LNDPNETKNGEDVEQEEEVHKETTTKLPQQLSPLEIISLNQLQIAQFLDNVIEDPLLFVYNKTVQKFRIEMENFIEVSDSDLKDIWMENKKELENIMKSSEELAIHNGYKRSIQKDTLIWSIPIYLAVIAISAAMYFIVPPDYMFIFLMIPFIFLCFSNSLVSKLIMDKRMKFRTEKTPFLKEQMNSSIERIRNVNQIILNDIKDILQENNFESTRFKAHFYNKNYEGITVLETNEQQKTPIYLIGIDTT